MLHITLQPGGRTTCSPRDSFRVPAGSNRVVEAARGHFMYCVVDMRYNLPVTRVQQSAVGTLRLYWKGQLKYTFESGKWSEAVLHGKKECP